FDPAAARDAIAAAALAAFCRHHDAYPPSLLDLPDPPAIVHVAGNLDVYLAATETDRAAVAVVGARRASEYGLEAARAIGRGLADHRRARARHRPRRRGRPGPHQLAAGGRDQRAADGRRGDGARARGRARPRVRRGGVARARPPRAGAATPAAVDDRRGGGP